MYYQKQIRRDTNKTHKEIETENCATVKAKKHTKKIASIKVILSSKIEILIKYLTKKIYEAKA